jgi:hypothetical protein
VSTVNTANAPPYDLGFLDRIVGVSWPSGPTDYVVLTIDATSATFNNQGPPPAPEVTFDSVPKGVEVLAVVPTVIPHTKTIPGGTASIIFLWFNPAPFPTSATFNVPVIGGQGIGGASYGTQFNFGYNLERTNEAEENVIKGNPDAQTTLPPLDLSSLDTAAVCASIYNSLPENQREDTNGGFTSYFTSTPPLIATVPGGSVLFAAERPVVQSPTRQSSTELQEKILIGLPRLTTGVKVQVPMRIILLGGADIAGPQLVAATLYLGITTKNPTVGQVESSGPGVAKASISGASSANSFQIKEGQSVFTFQLTAGRSPAVLKLQ